MVLERTLGLSKVPSEVCSTLDLIVLKNISAGGGCRTGWPSVLEVGGGDKAPDARPINNKPIVVPNCSNHGTFDFNIAVEPY